MVLVLFVNVSLVCQCLHKTLSTRDNVLNLALLCKKNISRTLYMQSCGNNFKTHTIHIRAFA